MSHHPIKLIPLFVGENVQPNRMLTFICLLLGILLGFLIGKSIKRAALRTSVSVEMPAESFMSLDTSPKPSHHRHFGSGLLKRHY
ncbi:MAG TPA: hypothetical protein PKL28_11175 [Rhodocyclaceae bacterium]|jgi:hypothetical protein|nr:hypothetical protein [Rhodocyclaceae bacterium]HNM81609.1 hypothetical protein [Rhodocyclaceae bacterium]